MLSGVFNVEQYTDAISKRLRYSLQNQSLIQEVDIVENRMKSPEVNASVKNTTFVEITGIDEELKSHFKAHTLLPSMEIKKAFCKDGRLVVSDFVLPGQSHDIRLSLQRCKTMEPTENLRNFIKEIQIDPNTNEWVIPDSNNRFHVLSIRYKIRTRYETNMGNSEGPIIVDITEVTSNEFVGMKKRIEVDITTRQIKELCKTNFEPQKLVELVPDLWSAILRVTGLLESNY